MNHTLNNLINTGKTSSEQSNATSGAKWTCLVGKLLLVDTEGTLVFTGGRTKAFTGD